MTKADHNNTVVAAIEFKKLLDETILADVGHGVNLTPFESEVYYTGGKISQLLTRFIEMFVNE